MKGSVNNTNVEKKQKNERWRRHQPDMSGGRGLNS